MGFTHGYALLVGVGGDLVMTATDATDLAALFKDPARAAYPPAQVDLLTNATAHRNHIFKAFAALRARVTADAQATVVVYYSGHGFKFSSNGSSEYFLCPTGFDRARMRDTGISDVEFTRELLDLPAKRLVVLLDCCHAAGIPLAKDGEPVGKAALPPAVLANLGTGEGQVVFASCGEGQRSYALQGEKNSVFTTCLLEALGDKARSRAGFACILDVVAHVMHEVPKRVTNQAPFLNSVKMLSHNLPICAVPATKGVPEPATGAIATRVDNASLRMLTKRRIEVLLRAYEKTIDLSGRLNVALAVEHNPAERAKLQNQSENVEEQAREFESKLQSLYAQMEEAG